MHLKLRGRMHTCSVDSVASWIDIDRFALRLYNWIDDSLLVGDVDYMSWWKHSVSSQSTDRTLSHYVGHIND